MMATRRSTPRTCAYCGDAVDGERDYRRHLHRTHDPSELGAIDRRRYERYRPTPSALLRAGGSVASALGDLRYPVGGRTVARYALYGALSSLFVAVALGVSP